MSAHRLPAPRSLAAFLAFGVWVMAGGRAAAQDPPPSPDEVEETSILGAPPAFDLSAAPDDVVHVEEGTRLHQEPGPASATLTRIDFAAELPALERRGGWARVRYGQWTGWVLADPTAARADSAAAAAETRPPPAPPAGPDPRLQRARQLLGSAERQSSLGPFTLWTDVDDPRLLANFDRLSAGLPVIFTRRYGLDLPEVTGSVVLFSEENDYLTLAGGEEDLASVARLGHAGGGLAALFLGERHPEEVRSLLVHELVHLLSERVLPAMSPTWLIEGLAEDLAYCEVGPRGRLVAGSTYGWREEKTRTEAGRRANTRIVLEVSSGGARQLLLDLQARWSAPERPPLEALLDLPWREFVEPEKRRLHYTMSGFFVRFLLANPERKQGFDAYLAALLRGEPADAATLLWEIAPQGADWTAVEADFGRWLEKQ